jgi:outer membrane receptor protein involved in Fe transport
MSVIRRGSAYLLCAVSAFFLSGAYAEGIEEIIVTAQKKEEGLQDVPLSVSAYTGDFMTDNNITNLMELTQFSPSMRFERGGTLRNSSLSMRGIGSSGQNAGIDGSVGLYLDGVFIPRQSGLISSLSDVSTIEVLKGPQGTLYGANTPAGLVNVNTADPTQDFEARIEVGAGNHGMQQFSGYVSGGLTDNLAARLTYWQRDDEGFTKLQTGGRANSREDWGVRLKALWTPADDTEIEFAVDYSDMLAFCCVGEWVDISDEALATFDRMAAGLVLDRDLIFPSRQGDGYLGRGEKLDHRSYAQRQAFDDIDHWGMSVRGTKTVLDGHELSVVASYREWDSNQAQDQDTVGIDVTVWVDQPEVHETTSLEVNLTSPADSELDYTLGLFYYSDDAFFWQQSQLRLPGCMFSRNVQNRVNSGALPDTLEERARCAGHGRSDTWDQTHDSIAAYAQVGYDITDDWSVTVGARVTQDDKSVDKEVRLFDELTEANYLLYGLDCPLCSFNAGNPTANNLGILFGTQAFEDSLDNTETTWSVSTQYFLGEFGAADDIMVYARFATGYKAPGINARPIRFPTIPTNYDSEISENIEVGMKSTWLDNRLRLNLAVYQNDFEDLQQIASNPASDPTGAVGTFVQNAGELDHFGVELDYVFQPNANWSFSGAVAYLDSEYKEFRGSPCPGVGDAPPDPTIPGLCDFTGLENVAAPEWRTNHTVRYSDAVNDDMDWFVQGSWIYNDDMYVTSDLDERGLQDSYSLFDFAAGLEAQDGRWDVTVWVRNADDEIYTVGLINGAVPGLFGNRGSKIVRLGPPRTYGARFSINF